MQGASLMRGASAAGVLTCRLRRCRLSCAAPGALHSLCAEPAAQPGPAPASRTHGVPLAALPPPAAAPGSLQRAVLPCRDGPGACWGLVARRLFANRRPALLGPVPLRPPGSRIEAPLPPAAATCAGPSPGGRCNRSGGGGGSCRARAQPPSQRHHKRRQQQRRRQHSSSIWSSGGWGDSSSSSSSSSSQARRGAATARRHRSQVQPHDAAGRAPRAQPAPGSTAGVRRLQHVCS